jgi:perosamine synthetase
MPETSAAEAVPTSKRSMSALTLTKLETLALHGGTPVREKLLPYGRQSLDDADIQAVVEVLKSDWLTTGRRSASSKSGLRQWVGARHAVSFSSGTAALHGAAFAAGLGPGR